MKFQADFIKESEQSKRRKLTVLGRQTNTEGKKTATQAHLGLGGERGKGNTRRKEEVGMGKHA